MRYIFVSYIIRYYGTIDDSSGDPIRGQSVITYINNDKQPPIDTQS